MEKSNYLKNNQGQFITLKKVRKAEKRKAIKEANLVNEEFFKEVMKTTEWKPVVRKLKNW